MLLTDDEIQERLESPINLMNRLRNATKTPTGIPSMPAPTTKDIGLDVEGKINQGQLRERAANVMSRALKELEIQLPNVQKPEKLAQIATEMNKVLNSTQDKDKNPPAQIIVYAPQVIQENHFQELTLQEEQL
jgi:hypothetical protein